MAIVKYLLMIYGNPRTWETLFADPDLLLRRHREVIAELTASGELVSTAGLTTADARTVRVRDGAPVVTDGPFTEAKEMLAGYYLVDCAGLERATEIAAKLPEAPYSPIEIRLQFDPQAVDQNRAGSV
jgi:hypothetical protein